MKTKSGIAVAVVMLSCSAIADDDFSVEPVCKVQACNKIERFSLNPFSHLRDSLGETCLDAIITKSQAVVGNVLSEESRWWQGSSINPTKKSVTRVTKIYKCQEQSNEEGNRNGYHHRGVL